MKRAKNYLDLGLFDKSRSLKCQSVTVAPSYSQLNCARPFFFTSSRLVNVDSFKWAALPPKERERNLEIRNINQHFLMIFMK